MPKPGDVVEPRVKDLERVLQAMSLSLVELDRLGVAIGAARLEHACDAVREELAKQGL